MWLTGRDRLETAGQLGRLGYGWVHRNKILRRREKIVTRMFLSSHRTAEKLQLQTELFICVACISTGVHTTTANSSTYLLQ